MYVFQQFFVQFLFEFPDVCGSLLQKTQMVSPKSQSVLHLESLLRF